MDAKNDPNTLMFHSHCGTWHGQGLVCPSPTELKVIQTLTAFADELRADFRDYPTVFWPNAMRPEDV